MKSGVKFFISNRIDDISELVNDFLDENDAEVISFNEVTRYDMGYCFCLVYKEK